MFRSTLLADGPGKPGVVGVMGDILLMVSMLVSSTPYSVTLDCAQAAPAQASNAAGAMCFFFMLQGLLLVWSPPGASGAPEVVRKVCCR